MTRLRPTYHFTGTPEAALEAWPIILLTLRSLVASATTDLFPDESWPSFEELPEVARAARSRIKDLAVGQSAVTLMGVDVPVTEEGINLLGDWGCHSIHTEVSRTDGSVLLISHDQADSVYARLTQEETSAVRTALISHQVSGGWSVAPERTKPWWRRR